MMNASITDEATAVTGLHRVRDQLNSAIGDLETATDDLVSMVVRIRPLGLLTVSEMATAIGRDRNYIDSLWSLFGGTTRDEDGKVVQTRVPVSDDGAAARKAYNDLTKAADRLRKAATRVSDVRAERNRTVAMVYGAKLLRPGAIAKHVGVDRNHVGRISRKQGVAPVHRPDTRNQYSAS